MDVFSEALIFLAAAAVVVPLTKRLGFGAVLGYLAAGVIIGPSLTGLVADVDAVLEFSEIGVVLLLFIIGLELQPTRLWVLRRAVFGFGSLQVLVTGVVLGVAARLYGADLATAVVVGFGLSLSSTALVLQMLAERKGLTTAHGRAAFGILLMQDLAVIPLIAIVPLLAGDGVADAGRADGPLGALRAIVVLIAFVVGGRYLLRPLLRLVASVQLQEVFTAAALLLVIGSALLMASLGFSMGLGAFLAGVLVADSEYRHQLQSDIEPFKGLLLGLFFIAVGMAIDLDLLVAEPGMILAAMLGLMAVKGLVLAALAPLFGLTGRRAAGLAVSLAQGGEFAFVLFTLAAGDGIIGQPAAARLSLIVTLSMAATPLLYLLYERFAAGLQQDGGRPYDVVDAKDHQVIICGFGRFGQIIARILNMRGIPFTALEINPELVDIVKRYGNKVYYGDAARLDLLRAARADRARALVVAVDDVEASVRIVEAARRHFPNLTVYARARDRQHVLKLMDLGVTTVIRDTLLSSIALASDVLKGLGFSAADALQAAEVFRTHDALLLERQYAIRDDEAALIESAKESATQLRRLFESDVGQR
jgi:monovalent cation:proton antiporter-2 (CPA2) family protein